MTKAPAIIDDPRLRSQKKAWHNGQPVLELD